MESGEGDEVDCELPEVRVELARESEAAGDSRHRCGDQVVEVTVSRCGQLQSPETDVVKCFVIDDHALVCVLDQLVD